MKNIHTQIFFILLLNFSAFGQKEDYNWMIGFTTNTPDSLISIMTFDFNENPLTPSKLELDFSFFHTNTIISNDEGELQCYSNGVEIRNNNHELIINGDEFIPSASNQLGNPMSHGSLLLPMPESVNQYVFLFGERVAFYYEGVPRSGISPLTYSYIDLNANGGAGEVFEKKSILCTDTLSSGLLTATRHANGRDWWILMNKNETNHYYRFLLDPEGIITDGFQTIGDTVRNGLAQANFSPDGTWYAQYNYWGVTNQGTYNYVDLYQFDRCTGLLSNHLQIKDNGWGKPGGVAFSPNSRYMYVSKWDDILQFDLEAPDIEASLDTVAVYDGFEYEYDNIIYQPHFYNMQNGPDGKIYVSCPNTSSLYLHVIDQPDSAGLACNVLQHHIELPAFNLFSLPNLPNYRLGALSGSPCDTLQPIAAFSYTDDMLEVAFEDLTDKNPTAWHWDFGDGMFSDLQHPVHSYASSGQYEVCLIAGNDIGSDTVCQEIVLMTDNIHSINSEQSLSIQPNPAFDHLFLNFNVPIKEACHFSIFGVTGEELLLMQLKEGMIESKIDISQLAAGIYFYRVNNKETKGVFSGKFIISE